MYVLGILVVCLLVSIFCFYSALVKSLKKKKKSNGSAFAFFSFFQLFITQKAMIMYHYLFHDTTF